MKILCKIFGHNLILIDKLIEKPCNDNYEYNGKKHIYKISIQHFCTRCLMSNLNKIYVYDKEDL